MEAVWTMHNPKSLPPPDARLIDDNEKIETEVDSQGLVKIDELIRVVRSKIDESYEWPRELDIHHFYWPAHNYPYTRTEAKFNPSRFRNLPVHKGLMPEAFHAWLHYVTLPPPMPGAEVMAYRIEAWGVANDLFKMARKTIQWERQSRRRKEYVAANPQVLKAEFNGTDEIGEEIMQEVFEKNLSGLEYQYQRLDRIPPEFRLVEIKDSPERLAADLGCFAMHGHANLVNAVAA